MRIPLHILKACKKEADLKTFVKHPTTDFRSLMAFYKKNKPYNVVIVFEKVRKDFGSLSLHRFGAIADFRSLMAFYKKHKPYNVAIVFEKVRKDFGSLSLRRFGVVADFRSLSDC